MLYESGKIEKGSWGFKGASVQPLYFQGFAGFLLRAEGVRRSVRRSVRIGK